MEIGGEREKVENQKHLVEQLRKRDSIAPFLK